MAITTYGGSGSVTPTLADSQNNIVTVFTTPNIANAIFIVDLSFSGAAASMAGDAASGNAQVNYADDSNARVSARKIKVGPNTPVLVAVKSGTSASCKIAYNYIGIVIS